MPNCPLRSRSQKAHAAGITALTALCLATAAQASPESLRMASSNLLQGPLDVALSPVVAGVAVSENLPAVSDYALLRAVYAPVGWLGLTLLQAGTGLLRTVSGGLQLVPALCLFPFEADLPASLDVFSQGRALVAAENPLAERPPWFKWVPLFTPFTIDARFAVISPASEYLVGPEPTAGYGAR